MKEAVLVESVEVALEDTLAIIASSSGIAVVTGIDEGCGEAEEALWFKTR